MSASVAPALDAIALQLAVALERYDRDTARVIANWPDMGAYREVNAQAETIRMFSAALPDARVQWVELLIARAELVHFLWRGEGRLDGRTLQQVGEHHSACVAALRRRCLQVAGAA